MSEQLQKLLIDEGEKYLAVDLESVNQGSQFW